MKKEMTRLFKFGFALIFLIAACKKGSSDHSTGGGNNNNGNSGNTNQPYVFDWTRIADSSTTALNYNFWNSAGYYNTTSGGDVTFNYWYQAHALDVLVDAYNRTQTPSYKTYINNWYLGVKKANGNTFIGQYYDDMGWIALAALRAYNATNDGRLLDITNSLWADIQTGWNTIMGGGIAWQKQQLYYKNTPANGPACILAARLYEQFGDTANLGWAAKIYNWWKSTLVNQSTGQVYDGTNQNNDGKLNTTWMFTYDQGLFIGAANELYKATGNASYLSDALLAANFTIGNATLAPSGILKDEGGGDGGLFKGIFVRYFIQLILNKNLNSATRNTYVTFLKNNAQTLWLNGTARPSILFGTDWNEAPNGSTYSSTELSGCMLMEGMALLKNNNLF